MENSVQDNNKPQEQPEQLTEHKSIAAQAIIAGTAGTIAAMKINTIGTAIDAHDLVKDKNGWGAKIKAAFSSEIVDRLKAETERIMREENKGWVRASSRVFKYTVLTSIAGFSAGAALGWVRGARVEDWRDIIKHPWETTKILFASEKTLQAKKEEKNKQIVSSSPEPSPPAVSEQNKDWQNYVKGREQNAVSVGQGV